MSPLSLAAQNPDPTADDRSTRRHLLIGAALLLHGPASRSQTGEALDTGGVDFARELMLRGTVLRRNGAGTRYKFVIPIYAAALYTAAPAVTTEAALDQRNPCTLRVVMLRDVNADELGRLLTAGMQKNASREELGRSLPGIVWLGEVFAQRKRLLKHEGFAIEWVPREGTTISINGVAVGPALAEPSFFLALMKIWLGNAPADSTLKQALLNGPIASAP
jgi:Chalcone isomerase-like